MPTRDLFDPASPWVAPTECRALLAANHYLGPTSRGIAYADQAGVMVVAAATSRRLPGDWLELTRWCIVDRARNAGSAQWGRFVRALRSERPSVTTLVSYSDPSVGHDGALYRSCNWWWAPTWHRLRPPPTGNGAWTAGDLESVKDRWVFALSADHRRAGLLIAQDDSVLRRWPWARYCEPGGADYRTFRLLLVAESVAAYARALA
jgi:hypothetical protein